MPPQPVPNVLLDATAARQDGPGPAALLPVGSATPLSRLLAALGRQPVGRVVVLGREDDLPALTAAVAASPLRAQVLACAGPADQLAGLRDLAVDGPLLLVAAEVVASDEALDRLLDDPRLGSAVLVGQRDHAPAVRVVAGRVTAAASTVHEVARSTAGTLGVLRVAQPDSAVLAAATARLTALVPADAPVDLVALALVALVRAGRPVTARRLGGLAWARPTTADEAAGLPGRLAAVDEDAERLRAAVKAEDGFFATFFVSPWTRYVARAATRRGFTPDVVTCLSMALGVLAAAAFAAGGRGWLVAGAALLLLAFAADCVDGQIARYTRRSSVFGGWLDSVFDRTKEYLAYAALAVGAHRSGDDAWLLAGSLLVLQTLRHVTAFSWDLDRAAVAARQPLPPLEQRLDRPDLPPRPERLAARGVGLAAALERVPVTKYAKRVVAMPVGERFALLAVAVVVAGASTGLLVVLVAVALSTLYTTAGRLSRSLAT